MRGLIVGTVKILLGWVLVVAGVIGGLHVATGRPPIAALGAGLLAGSLAWAAAACLLTAARALRERAAIRRATSGAPPQDGATVLVGHIDTAEPLAAPFDGSACVAYTYEITRDIKSGRTMSRVVLYRGVGLAPSQITTAAGCFRLLAVPTIEGAEVSSNQPDADPSGATLRRIASYVSATPFTPRTAGHKELEARWSDADGVYRSDVSAVTEPTVSLEGCRFDQRTVPRGAQVCVFGHYSESARAIVAPASWARPTRLLLGDPAVASAWLASRTRIQLVLAILLALAAAGVGVAFTSYARSAPADPYGSSVTIRQ